MDTNELERSAGQLLCEELLDGAWELEDPKKQLRVAKKALAADPQSCEALTLVALHTSPANARFELYRQALDAFEQRYGMEYVRRNTGMFWMNHTTRPYLRTLYHYGLESWDAQEPDLAIALFLRILKLDPADNLAVRYRLLGWLLAVGDLDAAQSLCKECTEESTAMLYYRLLIKIISEPEKVRRLQKAYDRAVEANPHVIPFLLGQEKLPTRIPSNPKAGSKEEAMEYCILSCQAWTASRQTLEILEILSQNYSESFPV